MDSGARLGHSAAALRIRSARCRGPFIDRACRAHRYDGSSDRQEIEDSDGARAACRPGSDRRLCSAMPLSDCWGGAFVRRGAWRAAKRGSRPPVGSGGAAALGAAGDANAACTSSQLRHAPAGARSRLAGPPGIAGPREPLVHANLYGGGRGASFGCVPPRPPPRLSRGLKLCREPSRRGNPD